MRGMIIRWVLNAVALLITAALISGIEIRGFFSALIASMVLGIVNAVIRPIVVVLTLPLNILTLGLFTLVINGLMLKIVGSVVVGFSTTGFWAPVLGALILTVISGLISALIEDM